MLRSASDKIDKSVMDCWKSPQASSRDVATAGESGGGTATAACVGESVDGESVDVVEESLAVVGLDDGTAVVGFGVGDGVGGRVVGRCVGRFDGAEVVGFGVGDGVGGRVVGRLVGGIVGNGVLAMVEPPSLSNSNSRRGGARPKTLVSRE